MCEKAEKFAVGQTGNKSTKYVEAAKGTNLFFAIYETEVEDKSTGEIIKKRSYATIPLNVVIDRQKRGLSSAPEDENGNQPKFVLSPNDLVYVPTKEEVLKRKIKTPLNREHIYKVVSFSENRLSAIPNNIAKVIVDGGEYSKKNKIELTDEKLSIKEICIPIRIDRLGNIITEL